MAHKRLTYVPPGYHPTSTSLVAPATAGTGVLDSPSFLLILLPDPNLESMMEQSTVSRSQGQGSQRFRAPMQHGVAGELTAGMPNLTWDTVHSAVGKCLHNVRGESTYAYIVQIRGERACHAELGQSTHACTHVA